MQLEGKHQDGVVQEVHVHQPADRGRVEIPALIHDLQDETDRPHRKSHQQRADRALPV
jgi:hypothetical protein